MNRLIATDGYHLTMGFLIEPEKALEKETHVLYARSGGPLVVSELTSVLTELLEWQLDAKEVDEADRYWTSQMVPFAREAWDKLLLNMSDNNGLIPISVRGVVDGEVVLPGDPIAVLEAPAILAAVIEPWLISRMAKPLQLATRFTKLASAVDWDVKRVFEVGLRAANSIMDHSNSIATLKKIGLVMTSSGEAGQLNQIAAGGSMGHRYTQRYSSDYDAFSNALLRMVAFRKEKAIKGKVKLSLLLDTRSTLESGLPAAIRLINENQACALNEVDISVRLDSGDLEMQLAKVINAVKAQITQPQLWPNIIIESGLTAKMVARLESKVIDKKYPREKVSYGVGGYLVGKTDRDFISLVYKLSSMEGQPVMKFSDERNRGKESYPGEVTLLERELTLGTRRLIGQKSEAETLAKFDWEELFVDLVKDGVLEVKELEPATLQNRIRTRWEKVAKGYVDDEKYPTGVAIRPALSPITRQMAEWLRQYRMDATGYEMPEIVCPIENFRKADPVQENLQSGDR